MGRCGRGSGSSGGIGPVYKVVDEGGGGEKRPSNFFFIFMQLPTKIMPNNGRP